MDDIMEVQNAAAAELIEKHKEKLPPLCGYDTAGLTHIPVGNGWARYLLVLCRYIDRLAYTYGVKIKVAQVKEKFGCLRFYPGGYELDPEYLRIEEDGSITRLKNQGHMLTHPEKDFDADAIYMMFDGARTVIESLCDMSCEICGLPGKSRGGGWMSTLCDYHYAPVKIEREAETAEYLNDCKEAADDGSARG